MNDENENLEPFDDNDSDEMPDSSGEFGIRFMSPLEFFEHLQSRIAEMRELEELTPDDLVVEFNAEEFCDAIEGKSGHIKWD